MKKIFVNSLLLSMFFVVWCNITNKNNNEYKLTWNIEINEISWESQSFNDEKENIPLCEEIDLIPFDELEIINIEDVVENCKYEEWKLWYVDASWLWIYFNTLFATKQWFVVLGDWLLSFDDVDEKEFCALPWEEIAYKPLEKYNNFVKFLEKWDINWKWIFDTVYSNHFINYPLFYHCDELCNQFEWPEWWENENHYFVHWTRKDLNSGQQYLLLDDKIYYMGWYSYICEDYDERFCTEYSLGLIKEWIWHIVDFLDNKIIVKKFIHWQLNEPYKGNPELLFWIDYQINVWTFKIETCEFKL